MYNSDIKIPTVPCNVEVSVLSGREPHVCNHLSDCIVIVVDQVDVLLLATFTTLCLLTLQHLQRRLRRFNKDKQKTSFIE